MMRLPHPPSASSLGETWSEGQDLGPASESSQVRRVRYAGSSYIRCGPAGSCCRRRRPRDSPLESVERVGIADICGAPPLQDSAAVQIRLRTLRRFTNMLAVLVSRCTLKEPAFGQVVVVWRGQSDNSEETLEVHAYRGMPVANLEAVLPSTRLVFRPADALRLDLVSIASIISAFFVTAAILLCQRDWWPLSPSASQHSDPSLHAQRPR